MLAPGLQLWSRTLARQCRHNPAMRNMMMMMSTLPEENNSVCSILERIQQDRRSKSLSSSPGVAKAITELLSFFPFAEITVERVLISCPGLLRCRPTRIHEYCRIIAESGDHNYLSVEEALVLIGSYPELLKMPQLELQSHLSELFGLTANFLVPWNTILLASPQLLLYQPSTVAFQLEQLLKYFVIEDIYHLLGNNPTLLEEPFEATEQKLLFLMKTMNVSAKRISLTMSSLDQPLDFYHLRYEFLFRSGNYQHPDPNQKGLKLTEAKPNFKRFCLKSERAFVEACASTLTLEEFNVFKALYDLELGEKRTFMPDFDTQNEESVREEDERFRDSYGKKCRGASKKII